MSTLVTRAGKGSPLTHNEVDTNFTNLNTDKVEKTAAAITGGTINNTTVGATTPSTGVFTTLTAQNETLVGTGQNFCLYSEQFDNAYYGKVSASVTANSTTSPIGTTTADTLVENSSTNDHVLFRNDIIASGFTSYVLSVYAKAAGRNFLIVSLKNAGVDNRTWFNVSTGVIGTSAAGNTASITNVGNGWYRCSITRTFIATQSAGLTYGLSNADNVTSYTGDGTSGVYLWGSQLEIGSTANTYIPTTTTAVYGTPTLSFSGVASIGLQSDGSLYETSAGTGNVRFYTNNIGQEQARVSHTASAVNYLQATGGATGSSPTISAQGSDTNIGLNLTTKGTGGFNFASSGNSIFSGNGGTHFRVRTDIASATGFWEVFGSTAGPIFRSTATTGQIQTSGGQLSVQTDNAGTTQLAVSHTASAVNFHQFTGSATGFGPVHTVAGSDTNISLVLQPKGTGALQAQQTTSTATGGNIRGANAVDWQTTRDVAARVASGGGSVVSGGYANTASIGYSVASGGFNNTAGYLSSVVGGQSNSASGTGHSAVVGGQSNTSNGYFNFIGGGFTNSGTSGSAVTTQSATMNGTTAVTLSGSNANIKVGQLITGTSIATYTYVAAISGTSLTLSQVASGSSTSTLSFFTPHGVVVGGGNNQATGSYSYIGGGGDAGTAANRNVASGDWSVVAGGQKNVASSNYSFVGGGGYNTASTGNGSVVCGGGFYGNLPPQFAGNTASGVSAFVGAGFSNQATGFASFVGSGNSNVANSAYSTITGGLYGTTRSIIGLQVFPAHNGPVASVQGVSQAALLVLGVETTNATATVLRSDTSAANTTNQVILPNNSAYYFRGEVVSGVTGGGNTKGWYIEGVIKRGANAASTALVGTPTVTSNYADAGASTWTIAVTADTTNGGLAVTFTGQAATTIRTVAQIRTTEMTY